jgi:hypothetical protein
MQQHDIALPIMSLPVIGSIPTMPTRRNSFTTVVRDVLPQVDKLFVFLDGFEDIPSELRDHPKIQPYLLPKQESLHSSSRFLAPRLFGSDAVVVLFDDDIQYPPDYVATIKLALAQFNGRAVVGYHGTIFAPPHQSYARHRYTFHFKRRLGKNQHVHELGTGTAAFVSSVFRTDPEKWRHNNMDDLYMAAEALEANLQLVALKREPGWITPLAEKQDDSLWRATVLDDRVQSHFMRDLLAQRDFLAQRDRLAQRDLLTQYVNPTWSDWWKRQ